MEPCPVCGGTDLAVFGGETNMGCVGKCWPDVFRSGAWTFRDKPTMIRAWVEDWRKKRESTEPKADTDNG